MKREKRTWYNVGPRSGKHTASPLLQVDDLGACLHEKKGAVLVGGAI